MSQHDRDLVLDDITPADCRLWRAKRGLCRGFAPSSLPIKTCFLVGERRIGSPALPCNPCRSGKRFADDNKGEKRRLQPVSVFETVTATAKLRVRKAEMSAHVPAI